MTYKTKKNKLWNIGIWLAQGILASLFIWAGVIKLTTDPMKLAAMWPWTSEHEDLVKVTGLIDLLAGIGLVLPSLLKIVPALTVYSAGGAFLLMAAAVLFHIARGEGSQIGINIVVAVLALFVAWGRYRKVRLE